MERTFKFYPVLVSGFLSIALSLTGCGVDLKHGIKGLLAPAETPRGIVAGKVTDGITGAGIDGVAVTFEPAVDETHLSTDIHPIMDKMHFSTDTTGFFYARIPAGPYLLKFSRGGYRSAGQKVVVSTDRKVTGDVVLDPAAPVIVYAGKDVTGIAPGSKAGLKAEVIIRDGSILKSMDWTVRQQDGRVPAVITEKRGTGAAVALPGATTYKKVLLDRLGREGRLLNRWMILGLGPSDLKEAGTVTLIVRAVTSSGTYSDTVDIIADLSAFAMVNPGLQNISTGKPVLLQGKDQASYTWRLAGPGGSTALLKDAATQNPHFTPDVPGEYTVSEGSEPRLKIYAGTWSGAIVARETVNKPWIGKDGCLCHYNDRIKPKFEAWQTSGHSEIFRHNITASYRYEEYCFACHMAGFHKDVNGGIREDPEYSAFLNDAGLWERGKAPPIVKPAPGNWDYILDTYPGVARLTNVQCENCHGPNKSEAHKTLKTTGAPERVSLSAEVCGTCHDRSVDVSYSQWQESGHANYKLAMVVGTVEGRGDESGNCGRCHSGQGFLTWTSRGRRTGEIQGKGSGASVAEMAALGLTVDKVQPLTCAVCHEPHDSGNSFRAGTEKVPVRIADDARMHPAEYGHNTGGRGALCIICHSTSGGPHNDAAIPQFAGDTAPHAAQADIVMGQNAFFVEVGKNKSHSRIEDTCIWCHMKPVPKQSEAGYNRGGVNHRFKTPQGLCSKCHEEFEGEELLVSLEGGLETLKESVQSAIMVEINKKPTVTLVKAVKGSEDVVLKVSDIGKIEIVESRGDIAVNLSTGQRFYEVPLSHINPGGVPLVPTGKGQIIVKAAWNYFLLASDRSRGAHNPQFVSDVLESTMTRLKAP